MKHKLASLIISPVRTHDVLSGQWSGTRDTIGIFAKKTPKIFGSIFRTLNSDVLHKKKY